MFARSRTQIDHVIGGGNRVRIVLHDQHGIAQVAQAFQDFDQPVRVARMQADRRLIEHVERADQMRAERSRQLDALRFAAGKRRGQPVKRQIIEAYFIEEAQALPNFFQDFVGDGGLGRRSVPGCRRTAAPPSRSSRKLP